MNAIGHQSDDNNINSLKIRFGGIQLNVFPFFPHSDTNLIWYVVRIKRIAEHIRFNYDEL